MFAFTCQTILTMVFVSKGGFELKIRDQYLVNGCFYIGISILFGTIASLNYVWPNKLYKN